MKKTMLRTLSLCLVLSMLLSTGALAAEEPAPADTQITDELNFLQENTGGEPDRLAETSDGETEGEQTLLQETSDGEADGEQILLQKISEGESQEQTELRETSDQGSVLPDVTGEESGPVLASEEAESATAPVDNTTAIPDGVYVPDSFSFTGGTGKVSITCASVTVAGGRSYAAIAFSSDKYTTMKAAGGSFTASVEGGQSVYASVPVALNGANRVLATTYAMSTPKEIEYYITVSLSDTSTPFTPGNGGEEQPGESETVTPAAPADGDYTAEVSSSSSMFKVIACSISIREGTATAVITLNGTGYDMLYMGKKEEAEAAAAGIPFAVNEQGQYTYTLTGVALDVPVDVAAHSSSKNLWYDRQLTFSSASLEKVSTAPEDGEYTAEVETSSSMFKVIACTLTVESGAVSALITLSGTGYDVLYMGKKEEAEAAAAEDTVPFVPDEEGRYTYTLSNVQLDTPMDVAAHSAAKNLWYDRQLTFKSDSLQRVNTEEQTSGENDSAEENPAAGDDASEEEQQPEEPAADGSTAPVNNATLLPDGSYTPESFTYSGGTGKVSITCSGVTVTGGRAYATVVFGSANYQYLKASGQIFYLAHTGGTSTFTIPIALNVSNTVLGLTTTMSTPHEVAYAIEVYIPGAVAGEEDTDTKIDGLTYVSTVNNEYAGEFTLLEYEDGYRVIRVNTVGRYLLIPEGKAVPELLPEDVTVITLPVEAAASACEEADEFLRIILEDDADGQLSALPGELKAPDYAALLRGHTDLVLLPGAFADRRITGAEDGEEQAELGDEEAEALSAVWERLRELKLPGFVDRSGEEKTEEARMEWLLVYGYLFGCEQQAREAYRQAIAAL